MGLLTSVNNLNYTLQQKEDQKEAERKKREKERQQKQEEKEVKERIKQEIDFILHSEFAENLQKYGSTYIIEYYNINKKNALLGKIWSNHIVEKNIKLKNIEYTTKIIEYKEFINDHFNKIYYKILKEEENIQKKYEQYIYYNTLQLQNNISLQENTQKKQYNVNVNAKTINKSINIILIILLAIVCFPVAIVIAACKNQK